MWCIAQYRCSFCRLISRNFHPERLRKAVLFLNSVTAFNFLFILALLNVAITFYSATIANLVKEPIPLVVRSTGPTLSSDLSSSDFLPWDCLKLTIDANKPQTLQYPSGNIKAMMVNRMREHVCSQQPIRRDGNARTHVLVSDTHNWLRR